MRTIKLTYEHRTANNNWNRYELVTSNGKEYERAVNIIHNDKDNYKIIDVKHIQ